MRRADVTAMRRIRDVNGLVQALTDADEMVRVAAAEALGMVGDERALAPLEDAKFYDESVAVRRAASVAQAQVADRLEAGRSVRRGS